MKKESGHNGMNQRNSDTLEQPIDVVLIGGGIMSATLGTFLHQLEPNWNIQLFERMSDSAEESSNAWNNAGTGHSALAEMNYTPEQSNGEINTDKATNIYEQFQLSRQFWAYLVNNGIVKSPQSFINSVPHMSFVWGEDNVRFLRKRYHALQRNPLFDGMAYSEDYDQIKSWVPMIMKDRDLSQPIAATSMRIGTDVNFGALTHAMLKHLKTSEHFQCATNHEVKALSQNAQGHWDITVCNRETQTTKTVTSKFVFIGAGGASLSLLQKSGIPEAKQYGGFPVGGQFLVTDNPELVEQHAAKVYGKASVGAPPMSVPHLDTRVIDGKRYLLFGPFASFSSKFLKNSSLWDLFASVNHSNVLPMAQVGLKNFDLVKYLVGQLRQSETDRLNALKDFFPNAKASDWSLWQAGQRVQIIKKDTVQGGELRLGTELVSSQDRSITALLGASPGASTSASIMLNLLNECFPEHMATPQWQEKVLKMIPSYGQSLKDNPDLHHEVLLNTSKTLQLEHHLLDTEVEPVDVINHTSHYA